MDLPFEVGALYNRQKQIHALLGGQQQGGISTPKDKPVIIAFTGEAGVSHGYRDFWDDQAIFHYYGEGQVGDMRYTGGNRAIEQHLSDGKRLIIFQMMGKGRPYRYMGQFVSLSSYIQGNTPDTNGDPRDAIVFRLRRIDLADSVYLDAIEMAALQEEGYLGVQETVAIRLAKLRTKQQLFRERLIGIEKGCRLTGIEDLRFLRASHIKPWASSKDEERTDGQNGLLLSPQADLLFDRGWISFEGDGALLVSRELPQMVEAALGIELRRGHNYGSFAPRQRDYLSFHRHFVFQANELGLPPA